MSRQLVIIDPAFQGTGGHHLSTNTMLAQRAVASGLKVVVVASEHCAPEALADAGATILPLLRHGIYHQHSDGDERNLAALNEAATTDLLSVPEELFGEETFVLVHTTNETNVLAVAESLTSWNSRFGAQGALILMFPVGVSPEGDVYDSTVRDVHAKALHQLSTVGKVRVYGIGESIAAAANELGSLRVEVVAPPIDRPDDGVLSQNPTRILLYMGDSRNDKGFHLVPETLRLLVERGVESQIVVQLSTVHPVLHAAYADQVREIASQHRNVEVIEGRISPERYRSLWATAKLACMFYDPRRYQHQTSNVCWESMAYGVPAVVGPNLWHGSELRRYGFEFIESETTWPNDQAAAIEIALARNDQLLVRARADRQQFLSSTNTDGLYEPVRTWND